MSCPSQTSEVVTAQGQNKESFAVQVIRTILLCFARSILSATVNYKATSDTNG